jgi:hypothetical protein
MSHQTSIRELVPGLTPFPHDIFVSDQAWLADHLLPLISIDLGLLRPDLTGTVVHMLCPIEPFDGYIGNGTEAFHNAYTAPNWFAFQLTDDHRYRFLGHEGYFQRAAMHEGAFLSDPYAHEHIAAMQGSYAKAKAHFEAHRQLAVDFGDGGQPTQQAYLDSLGGPFWFGNWAGHPPIPSAFQFIDHAGYEQKGQFRYRQDNKSLPDDGIEISLDGKPFFPVAEVAGYKWCAAGADAILLFYEPVSRTVLFTFDWT